MLGNTSHHLFNSLDTLKSEDQVFGSIHSRAGRNGSRSRETVQAGTDGSAGPRPGPAVSPGGPLRDAPSPVQSSSGESDRLGMGTQSREKPWVRARLSEALSG